MESLQIKTNTINTILKQVDKYFIKVGGRKVNSLRFDVGSGNTNFYDVKVAMAFDRILRSALCNRIDLIDDDFLEKTKLTINKLN